MKTRIDETNHMRKLMGLPLIFEQTSTPTITDNGFSGTYKGPEFNSSGDIAHQFSNTASNLIGNKLKELYTNGKFSKVDFDNIKMTTAGMGSGNVTYTLEIPFIRVNNKCEAYTSFDHRGGWGHGEGTKKQDAIKELSSAPVKGTSLNISDVKKTSEGLVEYWVQWKNPKYQSDCGGSTNNTTTQETITFNNVEDARSQLKSLPKNMYSKATISGNEISLELGGKTKLGVSGIYDPSEDTLNQRLNDLKSKYGYEKISDIQKIGNLYFVVIKTE